MTDLPPEEGPDSEGDAPQPLLEVESRGGEPPVAELYDEHLADHGPYPDAVVDGVGEQALEDVALAVDLPSVDLVEEGHHDEGVEDDGEVLGGWGVELGVAPAVDAEEALAGEDQGEENDEPGIDWGEEGGSKRSTL